jgi:5-methylcytosine-specific restriction enzyme subunit McrC
MIKEIEPKAKLQSCDTFGNLTLKPDIIVNDLIIDTKYKKIDSIKDIKQSDKYQMYTYGKNYSIKNTMLLYPKYQEKIDYNLYLGSGEKKINLLIKTMNLDCEECSYDKYISKMKRRIDLNFFN